MPKSEPKEPEKNSVADEKTVDNAEEELAVAEDSDGGVGIVVAVDEGEAIEDEHNGGGEAVVLLEEHGEAEEAASEHGDGEV